MENAFPSAYRSGFERLVAWANLLDDINVFPVADGDTGRNLVLTLSPFRREAWRAAQMRRWLLTSARGNSGNIAAAFFYELLGVERANELPGAIQKGMRKARQAVADPQPGTMLTVFDNSNLIFLVVALVLFRMAPR